MTPYQISQFQQDIEEQQDKVRQEWFINGETDAEFGCCTE